ncbi:hypothetical protein QR305_01719 [Bacteroides finegoldii]|uniref:Uncharacterized protein n=1 Tax=Bacteroides finegoldii CL09T03C10 TaxID=997888 RepID=K5CH96_9BACE|nr:hypothetical protein [Bacteroides finegoldii]EKJ92994.1 hypothetical protein HMPREF1057_00292 [Bacteroides finegoldii CL09T03C10]
MNFDIAIIDGMSRFDPKIHVVIEGAEFADYFWPAVEQYVECMGHRTKRFFQWSGKMGERF